jgi:hypothetical protein
MDSDLSNKEKIVQRNSEMVLNGKLLSNFMAFIMLFCMLHLSYAQSKDDDVQYENSGNGFAIELGPCTGLGFLYGSAKEAIDCNCFANVGAYGIIEQKLHAGMRIGGTSGKLIDDLSYGTNWTNGSLFNSMHIEGFLGVNLIDHKNFNIIPFAAFGSRRFNVREDVGEEVFFTGRNTSYSFGTAVDIKFNFKVNEKNALPGSEYVRQAVYLRTKFGVYPRNYMRPFNLPGGLVYVSFSIGYWYSPARVYEKWR